MSHRNIPYEDTIVRHISWNRLMKNDLGEIVGCFPEAFHARAGETYLSVNWLEFFSGSEDSKINLILKELAHIREIKKKQGLGFCNVDLIHSAFSSCGKRGRVIHTPSKKQESYSRVTMVTEKDRELSSRIHSLSCYKVVGIAKYLP